MGNEKSDRRKHFTKYQLERKQLDTSLLTGDQEFYFETYPFGPNFPDVQRMGSFLII